MRLTKKKSGTRVPWTQVSFKELNNAENVRDQMLKQTHAIEINEKECDDDNEDGDEEQKRWR